MGQKVNPHGLRVGVIKDWDSRWYADDKFTDYLHEDLKIKEFLKEKLAQAGVSRIVIERPAKKARVTIHSARPGVVIGKKGQDIELLRKEIQKMTDSEVQLNILEVRKPNHKKSENRTSGSQKIKPLEVRKSNLKKSENRTLIILTIIRLI